MSRENFYTLLELKTDPPENNKEIILKAIKKKQAEWSKLRNHPSKGRVAQQNLALLKEIKKIMLDDNKRAKEALSFAKDSKEQKELREKELLKVIEMLSGKGEIFESEYNKLIKNFNDFDITHIKKFIKVKITKDNPDNLNIEKRIKIDLELKQLSSLKLKKIDINLKLLNKKDLYHFLNTTKDKASSEILSIVKKRYIENNKVAAKTAAVTATSELLGILTGIFKNEEERTLYDNSLIMKKLESLLPFIEISAVNGIIEPSEYLYIIYEGNELSLDEKIVKEYISKYCKMKRCKLLEPSKKDILFKKKSPNELSKELYKMVKNRETREVEKLLKKEVNPNYKNEMGDTPLIMATYLEEFKIIKLLVEYGADVDIIGHNKMTPLIWASIKNNLAILRFLLSRTELIDHKDKHGFTALMWAASHGYKDVIKLLLEYNANTEIKNNELKTAQELARKAGFLPLFYLINDHKKADKIKDKIFEAIENNDLLYIRSLGKRDFLTENDKGIYPLNLAIKLSRREIIDYVISKRLVDFNKKNSSGSTYVIDAVKKKDLVTVTRLYEKGADLELIDDDGYSPLMHAITIADISIIKYLIDKKVNIEYEDKNGNRALTLAVWQQKLDIVTLLVDKGAEVLIFNKSKKDLLTLAKEKGDNYIIKYIESTIELKYPTPKSNNKPNIDKSDKQSINNSNKSNTNKQNSNKVKNDFNKFDSNKSNSNNSESHKLNKENSSNNLENNNKENKENNNKENKENNNKENKKPWWKFW